MNKAHSLLPEENVKKNFGKRNLRPNEKKLIQKTKWKLDFETCKNEAGKYNTRQKFREFNNSAYQFAYKKGWLDKICNHMNPPWAPRGHWQIKENCRQEVLKYVKISDFIKHSNGAYESIIKNNWNNELLAHFQSPIKPMNHWNFKNCSTEARLYNSRTDFMRKSSSAYSAALKNNWIPEICAHMALKTVPKGHWNEKENCLNAAKECKSLTDFKDKYSAAYNAVRINGWMGEVCEIMKIEPPIYGKWQIKENCLIEALKYTSISDMEKTSSGAYQSIHRNKWNREAFAHMICKGNSRIRYIYLLYFEGPKFVYVGLSYNPDNRLKQHVEIKDGCFKGSNSGIGELLTQGHRSSFEVISIGLKINVAQEYEKDILAILTGETTKEELNNLLTDLTTQGVSLTKFLSDKKFKVLNLKAAGALGGNTKKWFKESVIKAAIRARTRKDFYQISGAYSAAKKDGYLDEVMKLLVCETMLPNYWTKERIFEVAHKYDSISRFRKHEPTAYSKAHKEGYIKEVTLHMKSKNRPKGYWTLENCLKEAKKYKSINEFSKKASGAYDSIMTNGWHTELHSIFPNKRTLSGECNNREYCELKAKNCLTMTSFEKQHPGAYRSAYKNGWLEDITIHMKRPYNQIGNCKNYKNENFGLRFVR